MIEENRIMPAGLILLVLGVVALMFSENIGNILLTTGFCVFIGGALWGPRT